MPSKSFCCIHLLKITTKSTSCNCLNSWFAVLHTGKRWFIICPVEETPKFSQDISSDTTTQSPGSSVATQPADSGPARPAASRGDFVNTEQCHSKIWQLYWITALSCGSRVKDTLLLMCQYQFWKSLNIKLALMINLVFFWLSPQLKRGLPPQCLVEVEASPMICMDSVALQ